MKLFLLVGLFCICGTAQTLREKSWNAWRAGESRDPRQLEWLVRELRESAQLASAVRDSEAYAYVESLVDAIIQIPGRVEIEALLPFQKSWLPEILVILSRNPSDVANEPALLDLRTQSLPEAEWSAVNDLLYAIGSPAFFHKTLNEIRLSHESYVAEGGVGFCA